MSMSDPIADMLTRMRNAFLGKKDQVDMPASRLKEEVCGVLAREGYIEDYKLIEDGTQGILRVSLKYTAEQAPVVHGLKRVSKPSLRVYKRSKDLRPVRSGLGISIVSTSRGLMTGKEARQSNMGGEVLCEIW
jgi:small subunit ribosomal protein S8